MRLWEKPDVPKIIVKNTAGTFLYVQKSLLATAVIVAGVEENQEDTLGQQGMVVFWNSLMPLQTFTP